MKKLFLIAFVLMCYGASAQTVYQYWVQFKDKNNSPYSIENPSEYLSDRALARRAKYNIAIDSLDLPVNPSYLQAVAQTGVTLRNPSKWMNGVSVDASSTSVKAQLEALSCVSEVILYCNAHSGYDPGYGSGTISQRKNWQDEFSADWYGYGYTQVNQLGGVALHQAGYMGEGILIGIVDGGFRGVDTIRAFKPIFDEGRLVATRNFVHPEVTDVFNHADHGTQVFASLAAYEPGFQVGTAPKASYALCMSEDGPNESVLEEYNWISAIEFLDSLGADVVNTSLAYFDFDISSFDYTTSQLDGKTAPSSRAGTIATKKGILLVNGVGNDGLYGNHLSVPGDCPDILSVGAVSSSGSYQSFSSRGPTADGRIKPDVCALGSNVYAITTNGKITTTQGTSIASPILCGMMACLLQKFPESSPYELCNTVRHWGNRANNPDNSYGYGIPDFSRALTELPIVALNEYSDSEVSIFPNPSSGEVQISFANPDKLSIVEVYNTQGRLVISSTSKDTTLESRLSNLSQGIYMVRIKTDTSAYTIKLIRI